MNRTVADHFKPDISTPSTSMAETVVLDKTTRSFLRMGLIGLLAGGLGMAAMILLMHDQQAPRLIAPFGFVMIALSGWVLLENGYDRACLKVSTYGAWLIAVGIMVFSGGVRATTVITLPLIILMGGWLLGSRNAILLSILSILAVTGVSVAETLGLLPKQWPTSPFLYMIADTVVFALSGGVIVYLLSAHRRHLEEMRTLTTDLERKRAETAAAESLQRHKDLLDRTGRLARVGGWDFDIATNTLTWSDETFRIHDLPPGPTPGIDQAIAFYTPEARMEIEAAVARAINEGQAYDLELPLVTATGRRIWVRALCEPQFVGGRAVRLSGAFQDITAHREGDQALKASLNNLQRTLEATDDGIFGYDGTDPEGRVLFANDRFFEIWKIPPEKAATTTRADIIDAARRLFVDPDEGVQRIRDILAMGMVHEDKVPLNDGRVLLRRSIPLSEGSQVSRVWSFRDITAEENAKAALIASRDDAQRANAAKSEFLSRMSHELRTPMHAILGMMSLARRRMEDPKGIEQLDKAKTAADHLLTLINDILDISRIEAGRLDISRVEFRIEEVMRNVFNLVGKRASDKGLRFVVDQDGEIAAMAMLGDPLRLGQVLLNIVGNAIKFSDSGTITISISRAATIGDTLALRFEVRDEGIGIEPENLPRLFLAFEQADGSMTRKYGGSGLGLAISKRLVELMGGEIGVESTPGEGSLFWFTLQVGRPSLSGPPLASPAGESEQHLLANHAGARILLADDEPDGSEVVRELLSGAGLEVDTVGDGAKALSIARTRPYDLILMDMRMPVMNGIEATRAIRADSRNSKTPIVALTANAFEDDRNACLDAGMNDHLAKPVEPERLYATVARWLDQRA